MYIFRQLNVWKKGGGNLRLFYVNFPVGEYASVPRHPSVLPSVRAQYISCSFSSSLQPFQSRLANAAMYAGKQVRFPPPSLFPPSSRKAARANAGFLLSPSYPPFLRPTYGGRKEGAGHPPPSNPLFAPSQPKPGRQPCAVVKPFKDFRVI